MSCYHFNRKTDLNIARHRLAGSLDGFDGVDPGDDGSLVIGRSAAVHLVILLDQLEGVGVPSVGLGGRLNVEMAVDEDGLLAWIVAKNRQQNRRQLQLRAIRDCLLAAIFELACCAQFLQMLNRQRLQ